MQTILGSGGAIGKELAKALNEYTKDIRLVSRNPEKVNPTDELVSADLMDPNAIKNAIKGSSIVYVTIGFPYSLKIWHENWPKFMKQVLDACEKERCRLVFFDNIYMYDADSLNGMDELTPINPPSKKGLIRAEILQMLIDRMKSGKIQALVARSADFYGPGIQHTSMLTETVFKPISNGKKASWMGALDKKHAFTYTPDAGKATAKLGNSKEAYGAVWHLPTASNPPTGKEWVEKIATAMGKSPRVQKVPRFMLKVIGVFVPIMKEMVEMTYQYDRDYVFDSSKFEKQFKLRPTSYEKGIQEIIEKDYQNK